MHDRLWKRLGPLPFASTGRIGVQVQGTPLRVRIVELAVLRDDLDGWAGAFDRFGGYRWDDGQEYATLGDPREPGSDRWEFASSEIRLEIHDEPFRTLSVHLGGGTYTVRPLPDIAAEYPDVARVLRRAAG